MSRRFGRRANPLGDAVSLESKEPLSSSFEEEETNVEVPIYGYQDIGFSVIPLASVNCLSDPIRQSPTDIIQEQITAVYMELMDELAIINKDVTSFGERISALKTESADIILLSEASEAQAFQRREMAEESKVLLMRAHSEKRAEIYRRSNETVTQYAKQQSEESKAITTNQLIELEAAIAKEKEELEVLKKDIGNIQLHESLIEPNAISELHRRFSLLLQNIKGDLHGNLENILSENLHVGLEDAVGSISRIQFGNCERLNRLSKYRAYQKERESTLEKFLKTHQESRTLEENKYIYEFQSEWENFLFDMKIKNNESIRKFEDVIKSEIVRYRNGVLQTLQNVNKKNKLRLDDQGVAAAKRISDIRQRNANELLQYQTLHVSEKDSIAKPNLECDINDGIDIHSFDIDTVRLHCKRFLNEVNFCLSGNTFQLDSNNTTKVTQECEQILVDLRENIRRQQDSLIRDWQDIQHLLINLSKDADLLAETVSIGRASLMSSRERVDNSREIWEKNLRQVFSQCFTGGENAKVHRKEDVVGQVLLNLNCRIRALAEKSESISKGQRISRFEIQESEEAISHYIETVESLAFDIISRCEKISAISADTASREQHLTSDKIG